MTSFKEILDTLSVEEIVKAALEMEGVTDNTAEGQYSEIVGKTAMARYKAIVEKFKKLNASDNSEYGVTVLYRPIHPSLSDSGMDVCVYGYNTVVPTNELYDISQAKWEDVVSMNVCESSLAHILPAEIVAAIIREVAFDKDDSPENPEIRIICEDDFLRDKTYQALGVPDDRTDTEKRQDHLEAQKDLAEAKAAVFKFIRST